ncbi:YtxH domain-containing protein [Echinicola jeungdonensis]|uniref:YtxH domain-containing protein n=1 Tax=Echinicola jeungdonensis TaxID=709343 RepID=A0ABV5J565_9BACT|nr:YtxH domain-containing protein [Echinicola jeungdonensis]MDN3668663.1 YtxH domain-containing protein [Echinicola jeungdonensis]
MSKQSNSILAFVLGAGVGAAFGVLFAPDSGNNTRDRLSYQLSRYKNDLEDLVKDLVEGKDLPMNEARSEGKKVISEAKSKAENLLSDVNKLIDQINKGKN